MQLKTELRAGVTRAARIRFHHSVWLTTIPWETSTKLSSHTNLTQVTKVKPWSWELGIRTNMPTVRRWQSRLNVWRPNTPTAAHWSQILLPSPVLGITESMVCGGYSINKVVWCREILSLITLWPAFAGQKKSRLNPLQEFHPSRWNKNMTWYFCCHHTVPWSWISEDSTQHDVF